MNKSLNFIGATLALALPTARGVVICGEDFPVDTLYLVKFGASCAGSFPDVSGLPDLRTLRMGNNDYTGPIGDLTAHTDLVEINFYNNQLAGTVPDLSALTKLHTLSFSKNQLSGSMPDMSALDKLSNFAFAENQLIGSMPFVGAKVRSLSLFDNAFTGTVPDFSDNAGLYEVKLQNNQFTGSVPDFSSCPILYFVDMRNNQLTGTMPHFTADNAALKRLYFSDNLLTGAMSDLSALVNLEYLLFANNVLTGVIPDLSSNVNLRSIELQGNQLAGRIPDLSPFPNMFTAYLAGNDWWCPLYDYSHVRLDDFPQTTCSVTRLQGATLKSSAVTADAAECEQTCDDRELCAGWSFWTSSSWCGHFASITETSTPATEVITDASVSNMCEATLGERFDTTDADNVFISRTTTASADECCDNCLADPSCVALSYKLSRTKCVLLSQADGATVSTQAHTLLARVVR